VRAFLLAVLLLVAACCLAEEGLASWYGGKFQGRRTASGEIFDTRQFTAAHKSLPFGARVLVTNLSNGRSVTVRINDRGPFVAGRVIDLSLAAAAAIGLAGRGVAAVRLEVLAGDAAGEPRPEAGPHDAGPVSASSDPGGQPAGSGQPGPVTYRLQLGSFRQRANAEGLLARLADAGLAAELEAAGGGITRVVLRSVPFAELSGLRQRLAAAGWAEALVRLEP
jgi:rare lipoprotein A